MTTATDPTGTEDVQAAWSDLVEALAEGRLPILETMKGVIPHIYEKGDHEGFVTFTRAYHVLISDRRILERMHQVSWPRLFGQLPANFKWISAGVC